MSSLIKEINRYMKHLPLRKTDVLKTSVLSEQKFEEMYYLWIAKRCKVYSQNLFWLGDKRFLSEFLRKWGWFHGHNQHFPKYLG